MAADYSSRRIRLGSFASFQRCQREVSFTPKLDFHVSRLTLPSPYVTARNAVPQLGSVREVRLSFRERAKLRRGITAGGRENAGSAGSSTSLLCVQ
jgi:hypothetical protein